MNQTIKLELDSAVFSNLRALVIAGAKSADTGAAGIMAAAQLLQIMVQAAVLAAIEAGSLTDEADIDAASWPSS